MHFKVAGRSIDRNFNKRLNMMNLNRAEPQCSLISRNTKVKAMIEK